MEHENKNGRMHNVMREASTGPSRLQRRTVIKYVCTYERRCMTELEYMDDRTADIVRKCVEICVVRTTA